MKILETKIFTQLNMRDVSIKKVFIYITKLVGSYLVNKYV